MDNLQFVCTGRGGRGEHGTLELPAIETAGHVAAKCPNCGLEVRLGYRKQQQMADAGIRIFDISLVS